MLLAVLTLPLSALLRVQPRGSTTRQHPDAASPSRCCVRALDGSVAAQAAEETLRLRRAIEDAEEELLVEVQHAKKFMWRGSGLRHDFEHARDARRRALVQGAADNEVALGRALEEAEAAGLPQEYMEDAIRTVNQLAITRAELLEAYKRDAPGDR